jgi:hypothetical protein
LSGGITRVQAALYLTFSVHIKLKKSDLCKKYRETVVELAYKKSAWLVDLWKRALQLSAGQSSKRKLTNFI